MERTPLLFYAASVQGSLYDRVFEARDFTKDQDFARVSKNVFELAKALETGDKRWPKDKIIGALKHTAKNIAQLKRHC